MLDRLHVDHHELQEYLRQLERKYHAVPYHNIEHASDVAQAVNALLCTGRLRAILSDMEVFATIFAGAIHDVAHPGVFSHAVLLKRNLLQTLLLFE